MIALDTNVLVRLITKDDFPQTQAAAALLRTGGPFWVSRAVVLELGWVLGSKTGPYRWDRRRVSDALIIATSLPGVTVEEESSTRTALRWHRSGLDLGDALIRTSAPAEALLATFDERLVRAAAEQGVAGVLHVSAVVARRDGA